MRCEGGGSSLCSRSFLLLPALLELESFFSWTFDLIHSRKGSFEGQNEAERGGREGFANLSR